MGSNLSSKNFDSRLTCQPFQLIVLHKEDICVLYDGAELDDVVFAIVEDLDIKQFPGRHLPQSVVLAQDAVQLVPDLAEVLRDCADPLS